MKFLMRISLFTISFLIYNISIAHCTAERQNWPLHLRLLAGPPGGQWFLVSEPVTKILSQEVLPSSYRKGGGISNLEKINNDQGELGFSLTSFLGGSASGVPEYAGIKTENIRFIANIYPQVLYFLIRTEFAEKHQLKSVDDLLQLKAPVRFALLKKGTGSEFFVRILLHYGYTTNYDELKEKGWQIFFNNYPETADNFVAGNLDCFAYTAGTRVPLLLDMEDYTKFTALSISDTVLDTLKQKFGFNDYTIAPDTYKNITYPVKTLSDFTCMVVHKDLADDLVESILASLWKNKEELSKTLIEFNNFSRERALPKGLPIHPGAEKFWKTSQE